MKRLENITKTFLIEERKRKQTVPILFISGSNLHSNAQLYKYYFWIYAENSEYSSSADVFFKEEHKLSAKKAFDMMKKLQEDNIGYAFANKRYYRLGNKTWDYEKLKKDDSKITFAPSYDDDEDEVHESGHK